MKMNKNEDRFQYVCWQIRQLIYEINHDYTLNCVTDETIRKSKRLNDYLSEYLILKKNRKEWVYL